MKTNYNYTQDYTINFTDIELLLSDGSTLTIEDYCLEDTYEFDDIDDYIFNESEHDMFDLNEIVLQYAIEKLGINAKHIEDIAYDYDVQWDDVPYDIIKEIEENERREQYELERWYNRQLG